jgi:hypothetical protein
MYSFQLLPHNYEGNPVQSYSDCHLVVVYVSRTAIRLLCIFPESWSWDYSHGHGIIHMVLTSKYLKSGLRVAIMPIYMLYGCWVI